MTGEQDSEGRALLTAIAAKDDKAIAAFYRLFETTVYRFALSRLNDPTVAADILNEVMLEVWKSAAKFEGRSKVSTWLLGITHFKIVDHFRASKRHDHQEIEDDIADDSTSVQQDALIEAAQDANLLQSALQKLSPEHRQVLHLAFFEDLNYSEISEIMGVPEGTIKSRIYHAKKLAKTQLQRLMVAP